jgi:uncharacterized protein (TIGR02453 family)
MKTEINRFNGFFAETINFFKELKSNNNKKWFDQHQKLYEDYVLNPAKDFIIAMGGRLSKLSPNINADPRVNKSLFRINRDTRFSIDKSPYKTNLGIIFWDDNMPRMESSVFYFHLEAGNITLGTGIYKFTKHQLEMYRNLVLNPIYGEELFNIIKNLSEKGYYFGGNNYKKVPKGYDTGYKNTELLLYDGLYVSKSLDIPEVFFSSEFVDFCYKYYKKMLPVQKWLSDLINKI